MVSKGEAIQRLKKMGVMVADDQSIITVLLPDNIPLQTGIKDIKDKLKTIGYDASFCIKHGISDSVEEVVSEESINDGFLSMDDDGQFTFEGFDF
ncbi:MAG: hypothetical protein KIG50_03645 [Lachnospiraceae bacterium]|nr:hypothetical protein [Lachnospiraceae bacterium]